MKKAILLSALSFSLLNANAQSNKAYAITSDVKGTYNWVSVREIDLTTGEVVKNVFDPMVNTSYKIRSVDGSMYGSINGDKTIANLPTFSGVAAAAYDEKHNRLYFTNMRGNELRYFDLSTNEITLVINKDIAFNTGEKFQSEANVITRMVIAADGYGYALTNDGNNLIRFTTDAKPVVTNLGSLIDSKKNGGVSIHNQCSSWGGDMIADAYGNLHVFSMKGNVFVINPQTRIAEHVGTVKGLPANFPVNGAAVDANGDVLLSCASQTDNYYKLNLGTMEAVALNKKGDFVWNASDLASSNIAYAAAKVNMKPAVEVRGNNVISVYPNPVETRYFNINFEKVLPGKYTIELTDVSGRKVLNQVVNINGVQAQRINLPRATNGGMYLIKVMGEDGKSVYNDKVVVQ